MSDTKRPTKFYPYYKVAFLVDGDDKESSFFSYPKNLKDDNAFGALAANIEITKNEQGVLSYLGLRIFNMSENHRNMIFKEPYYVEGLDVETSFKRVWLQAGYLTYDNGQRWLNWIGDIVSASSYRQGDNIVTEIVANQKGFFVDNVFIQLEIEAGMKLSEVINTQFNRMVRDANYYQDIKKEAEAKVGDEAARFFDENGKEFVVELEGDYDFKRPKTLTDTVTRALDALMSYVPNARVSIKGNQYYITDTAGNKDTAMIINAEAGMQATPRVYGQRITLTTMFEPEIDIATIVEVQSLIEKNINGQYSVVGYTHNLTLGEGTRSSATTTLNLMREDIVG